MNGHVYRKKKKDGSWSRWYAVSDVPPGPDGRRRQKTTSHDTKREAEAALRERRRAIDDGVYSDSKLTVGSFLNDWLTGKVGLRPSTARSYEMYIRLYLRPHLGHLRLRDLRPQHIDAMYASLRLPEDGRPLSPLSIKRVHATLLSALNTAVKRRQLPFNPAISIELEKFESRIPIVWSIEDLNRFIDHHAGDRNLPLFTLIAMRGLRRGEAVGLRWEDVDLDEGLIRIRQQVVQVGYKVVVGPPKTRSGRRTISLDTYTSSVLKAHKTRQIAERLAWGPAWTNSGYVFTREDGTVLHPERVTRTFQRMAKEAGVPVIRLHDLRHTAASLALAAGVSLKVVSEQLGHSSVTITADLYQHVSPSLAKESAESVASLINRSGDTPR